MKAASLHDAKPEAWKEEMRPDPTREELTLVAAAKLFAEVDDRVQAHEGPRSGPGYLALVTLWRSRHAELLAAARAVPGETA